MWNTNVLPTEETTVNDPTFDLFLAKYQDATDIAITICGAAAGQDKKKIVHKPQQGEKQGQRTCSTTRECVFSKNGRGKAWSKTASSYLVENDEGSGAWAGQMTSCVRGYIS